MVPCDYRTKTRRLRQEYTLLLRHFSDRNRMEEYTKVLIAGGLSKEWIQSYLRRDKTRLLRRMRQLRSRKARDKMTRFFAIPFFVAIGKK
jgi:hypothetical protein